MIACCIRPASRMHAMQSRLFLQIWNASNGVLEMSGDAGVEEINQISVSPHWHIAASAAADDNRVTCRSFKVCVWLLQLLVFDSWFLIRLILRPASEHLIPHKGHPCP